ncbi:hypothetical protein M569_11741, partial [Genlisea aurea]
GDVALILVEFLEVAINSIVFLKGLYPNGAFERRRYMNVVVHRARHPELNDYIHSAVHGLLIFITKELVDSVAVILFDNEGFTFERFVFKINLNPSYNSNLDQKSLEFSLRSFLIKLPLSQPLTKTLSHNCRWEIVGYFKSLPDANETSKEAADLWIPTDAKQWSETPVITPIKSMASDPLGLQLYVEHPS